MEQVKTYENYPCRIIIASNFVSLVIYLIGIIIISKTGLIWLGIYVLYILGFEIRLLKYHCVNCYYYGKYCAFGKGKLSSLFFKKGDPDNFLKKKITWKDILPDFLISLIPLIAGIILLIIDFNWLLFLLIVLLILLTTAGNGFIRGSLACKYCKQKELGCSAEHLFNKNKK